MKLISLPSLVLFVIAFVVGRRLQAQPSTQWHEGEKWERFLDVYDNIANEQYKDCESRLVPTTFGDTQVYLCGSPENSPVALFHGISACSLMYGEWLVPRLSESHYTVAIDTLCDMGRSRPKDGVISNCFKTQKDTAEWVSEIFQQLDIEQASLIGYSFGSFLASCVALKKPQLVDKMVLMAPAAMFAPISLGWLARAMTFGMVQSLVGMESSVAVKMRNWFFGYMATGDPTKQLQQMHPELRTATDAVGMAQVGVKPVVYSVETLSEMNGRHPTLLIIGENETVTDAGVAIETATQAGIKVKTYPNSGHLLFAEYPRDEVIDVAVSFLDSSV